MSKSHMFGANILLGSLNSGPLNITQPSLLREREANDDPDAHYSQASLAMDEKRMPI